MKNFYRLSQGANVVPLMAADLAAVGVGVAHHFGGGSYIKETMIPAGTSLAQHGHGHDHLSYLVSGSVMLTVDGKSTEVVAPACLTIEAGKVHAVHAKTDAIWLCVWATDCTDGEKVDAHILGGNDGHGA